MILGSFVSAIIHRERLGLSWVRDKTGCARSQCPQCAHILGIKNLIPVFSWLYQRGKCKHCGSKITVFYPLLELFSAFSMILVFFVLKDPLKVMMLGAIYPFLISFIVLFGRFGVFSKRLLIITAILSSLFLSFHFYFAG